MVKWPNGLSLMRFMGAIPGVGSHCAQILLYFSVIPLWVCAHTVFFFARKCTQLAQITPHTTPAFSKEKLRLSV